MHDQRTNDEKNGVQFTAWEWLEFQKDDVVFYRLSCRKGSQQIIMIKYIGGWDKLYLPLFLV